MSSNICVCILLETLPCWHLLIPFFNFGKSSFEAAPSMETAQCWCFWRMHACWTDFQGTQTSVSTTGTPCQSFCSIYASALQIWTYQLGHFFQTHTLYLGSWFGKTGRAGSFGKGCSWLGKCNPTWLGLGSTCQAGCSRRQIASFRQVQGWGWWVSWIW